MAEYQSDKGVMLDNTTIIHQEILNMYGDRVETIQKIKDNQTLREVDLSF